mmetsp:Transcript_12458/g.29701  ORF Transcript_12458/g.29701 Transcript_12458/m.29701 type:complete len:201 (-) Transcript_12458:1136-1738(-)
MIAQASSCHSWPWLANGHNTFNFSVFVGLNNMTIRWIQYNSINSKEWQSARSWLHRGNSRNVCNNVSSSLRLPVGIDDGAFGLANNFVVPSPCLGVDGFTNSSQNLQTAQIVFLYRCRTVSHQETNGSWCSVELSDLVSLHHIPVAAFIWVDWSGFKHKSCCPVQEWPVYNIRVASDPSTIGNTCKNVIGGLPQAHLLVS